MSKKKFYTIRQVAEQVGVHPDTIRRWLRAGKVPEPDRDRNRWRVFTEDEIETIRGFANRRILSSEARQNTLSLTANP